MLVDVSTTKHQDKKLAELLITMNEQRIAIGKLPFDTVEDMAHSAMSDQIDGWVMMADAAEVKGFSKRYEAAPQSIRDAVKAALESEADPQPEEPE